MGEDKAFIEIEGISIINRIQSLLRTIFNEIIIVGNKRQRFANVDSRIYSDLLPERGVLGGLYTGLFFSSYQYSFCVACDMPFLKQSVIEYLITKIPGYDVIVPRTIDGLQPLHAIYSKSCIAPIRKVLDQGKYSIIDFYPLVKVRRIEENEFSSLDPLKESFINVNTPEELLLLQKNKYKC
jgi:molybdopterin-guanine dinucleotide biosynthesis protein A